MAVPSTNELLDEIKQLKAALDEALKDRDAAWNEQARLMNEVTELKKKCHT